MSSTSSWKSQTWIIAIIAAGSAMFASLLIAGVAFGVKTYIDKKRRAIAEDPETLRIAEIELAAQELQEVAPGPAGLTHDAMTPDEVDLYLKDHVYGSESATPVRGKNDKFQDPKEGISWNAQSI